MLLYIPIYIIISLYIPLRCLSWVGLYCIGYVNLLWSQCFHIVRSDTPKCGFVTFYFIWFDLLHVFLYVVCCMCFCCMWTYYAHIVPHCESMTVWSQEEWKWYQSLQSVAMVGIWNSFIVLVMCTYYFHTFPHFFFHFHAFAECMELDIFNVPEPPRCSHSFHTWFSQHVNCEQFTLLCTSYVIEMSKRKNLHVLLPCTKESFVITYIETF